MQLESRRGRFLPFDVGVVGDVGRLSLCPVVAFKTSVLAAVFVGVLKKSSSSKLDEMKKFSGPKLSLKKLVPGSRLSPNVVC